MQRRIRMLFLAAMVLLPVQLAVVGVVGRDGREPWPAVVFPGFATVPHDPSVATTVRTVFVATFADGGRARFGAGEVLAPVPGTHRTGFLRHQCRPARLSGTPATERCRRPAARAWLGERLAALAPGRLPVRLDVTWEEVRFDPAAGSEECTPIDTLTIALAP